MVHKTSRSMAMPSMVIRGAYFYIHEKRTKNADKTAIPEDQQKYEFVGLIPKLNADPAQCANYKFFSDLAMSAVQGQEEWRGTWPAGGNWPIKDGDAKVAKYPWQAGCWVINFSTNFAPKVATQMSGPRQEIPARRIGTTDLYKSGDYCVVSTYAFTYDNKTRGVKFDMEGVLFVAPGEVIGTAARSVDEMFGTTAGPQGGAPAPMPSVPAAPPIPAAPMGAPAAPTYQAPPPAPAPHYAAPAGGPPMPPPAPSAQGLPPFPGR